METLSLFMAYGLIIVLDVLRHIRFVITRNTEPKRIFTNLLRGAAFIGITVLFTGASWKIFIAFPLYLAVYWIFFDSFFEFSMPAIYRMLVHPEYQESLSGANTFLDNHFPGLKGIVIKWLFLIASLIIFLVLNKAWA